MAGAQIAAKARVCAYAARTILRWDSGARPWRPAAHPQPLQSALCPGELPAHPTSARPCRDPYIIGGQFIWGCSLNDYAGCLQDAKQGDNSRHCQWDEKNNLCIIDPMHTQKWILEK